MTEEQARERWSGKKASRYYPGIPPQVIKAWLYRLLESAGPPV